MKTLCVEGFEIPETAGLDRISVLTQDFGPGKGQLTLLCYGAAWTAYWGAMGESTLRQFVARADTGYLVSKLGITPLLKQRKRDHQYLGRIVAAVKVALNEAERGEGR